MADMVRGRRRRYILVLMALTALTLATLDQRQGDSGPIGAAGRVAHRVVQPVSDAADAVFSPLHDWWHGFWHHGDIVKENRRLRRELEAAIAKAERNDNSALQVQKYIKFFAQTYWSDYKSTGATVIGDSPGNNETTVTINRGSEAGIRAGMAVVGQRGLIGSILQSWPGGSKVMLITDPKFGVAARTLVDDLYSTLDNDGAGVLRMIFAGNGQPKHFKPVIKVGDEIVTCGCAGSMLPPGVPIGHVSEVSVAFDGSSVRVAVTPTLDRPSLEEVKVILWVPHDPTPPRVRAKLAPSTTTTTTRKSTSTTTTRKGN